jgi:sec-independent protein translocase protein TatC
MINPLPHLLDMPMSLGDHLEELRRRMIMPLLALAVCFIAAFAYNKELKTIYIRPLIQAIEIAGPKAAHDLGLDLPKDGSTPRILTSMDLTESAMVSMSVSFYAALAATIPILVYQVWKFVSVGLLAKERQLAFLFVPAGIIFFYAGAVLGYFWGLPYYFAWMIEWTAGDPTTKQVVRQAYYQDSFTMMTVCFGLVMDIPWLVMVLVRVGFVTPDQLAKFRKLVVLINTVVASLITPPDGTSMIAMMIPLQLLFEGGLAASRLMMWNNRRLAAREEAEARAQAQREDDAHHHGPGDGH